MDQGIIVKYDERRGFGFIRSDAFSEDIFVHIQNVKDQKKLLVGQNVSFNTKRTNKGLSAVDVVLGREQTSPYVLYGMIALLITAGIAYASFFYLFESELQTWNLIFSYMIAVNLSTFLFYGYDKMIAGTSFLRVPELVLHGLALIGGSPVGFVAQKFFHHKTIKTSFQLAYWIIVIMQIIVLVVFLLKYNHFI
ncbi:MAG: cold shock and DUF1294 domain-containing protein [Thiomargarita sp.]|nr:cold shock and DUF1294 domain-containing protein [Thiomargarita sp.]